MKNKTHTKLIATTAVSAMIIAIATVVWDDTAAPETALASKSPINDHAAAQPEASISSTRHGEDANTTSSNPAPAPTHQADNRQYGYLSVAAYEAASIYGQQTTKTQGVDLQKIYYDASGNLVLTSDLRQLIEHFLLGSQEEGLDQSIARIKEYIEMTLPAAAAAQALAITDQYINFKNMASEVEPINQHLQDVNLVIQQTENSLEQRKRVRREAMPADVVEAFFGNEERYDDYNLTRLKVNASDNLTYEEKDALIARAELLLPKKSREQKRRAREEKNLERKIAQLESEGNKRDEIYQLRKDFYGEKAAQKMAYFEDDSDQWTSRVAQFYQDKVVILQQDGLSTEEKKAQVDNLKSSLFSKEELIKLAVQEIRKAATES